MAIANDLIAASHSFTHRGSYLRTNLINLQSQSYRHTFSFLRITSPSAALGRDCSTWVCSCIYLAQFRCNITYGQHPLGFACNMAKILHLREDQTNITAFNKEMSRRLLCTLAVMDRTLTPSLNRPCYFSPEELISDPLPENGMLAGHKNPRLSRLRNKRLR